VPPSKAVGRNSYQLVAQPILMETGAQGFPPKNGPPVFPAAEDKAPGLQPASVQQHGASAPKTLTAGAAGAACATLTQVMQSDPGHRHGDGKPVLDADAAGQAVAPTGRQHQIMFASLC
jgi:hypothetical protein